MSQRTAKLLRKISNLTGKSDNYIKREYKKMTPALKQQYLSFMQENLKRIAEMQQQAPKETIVTDMKVGKEE